MQNARSLRQQWLTPKATDVVEKMQWAEQHLPPAWLFARTEYAVSQLIQSNGDLHRSAFGRGQVSDAEVKRHLESIKELDSIIQLSHGIIDAGLL
jgi:hypothetical protein